MTRTVELGDVEALPELARDAHKGAAGRVTCVVGSRTMPGAAILVARAAQRAGAGLVTIACVDVEQLTTLPVAAPEAILLDLHARFGPDGTVGPDASQALESRAPHARLVGPGLGDDRRTRALVAAVLGSPATSALALDADALNALEGEPERLVDVVAPVVLTPHPGEAERLLGRALPADDGGRLEAALELAARARAVVCVKGAGTIVTDGERVFVNGTGNEGMATAGAGDVLAGILVAYLAALRGDPAHVFDAAVRAVHVHGAAGDLAARALGARAVVASDLVAHLAEAQRREVV